MRNPQERLAEIHKRADARIAAIHRTKRKIASVCATVVMVSAIALGVYNAMSVPQTPPIVPPTDATTTSFATSTTTVTTVLSTSLTATTTGEPSVTQPIHVTVTTDVPILSTVTTVVPTVTTRTTTRRTTVPATTSATTPAPSFTTSQSEQTTTRTETTTSTLPEDMATAPPTTTSGTVPITTTTEPCSDGEISGNIQTPSHDEPTTTTGDPIWQGATATKTPTTTTTTYAPTATPYDDVVMIIDSVRDVSVGDTITVEVAISDYHCIVAGELYIQYDPDALQLLGQVQSEFGNVLNGAYALEVRCPAEGDIELLFSSSATEGSIQGGTILRLTFQVQSGIRSGTSIICEVTSMTSNHGRGDYDTPVTVINGKVTPADPPDYSVWV